MAAPRFLALISGRIKQVIAIVTSAGAGDGEKIVATNTSGILDDSIMGAATTGASKVVKTLPDGTLDPSIMPSGIGADTVSVVTSEALAANDLVNIWNDAGTAKARKADATTEGKEAHGFVLSAVSSGLSASVYLEGKITGLAGMTAGARQYQSTTPGLRTETPPSTAGNVVQVVGTAVNATTLNFEPQEPVTVA